MNTHVMLSTGAMSVVPVAAGGFPAAGTSAMRLAAEGDMPRYEYILVDVSSWEFGQLHHTLSEMRGAGWEVADVFGADQPRLRPGSAGLMIRLRRQARTLAQAS